MDAIAEWTDAQARVIEFLQPLTADEAEVRVPACPAWTVRQLVAHMVGLNADVLAGDEPDDHNSAWTQHHVDQRADRSLIDIVTEWQSLTEPMQAWMAANGTRPLGDVVIHEQDLRGALGVSGAHHTAALAALRDRMAAAFAERAQAAGHGVITLMSPEWTFTTGDSRPTVVLSAAEFELTRALMSRRSAAQLRRWTTAGEIDTVLALFAGLGPLPDADLTE